MKFISRKHFLRMLAYGSLIKSIEPYKASYKITFNNIPTILPYLHMYNISSLFYFTKYNLVSVDLYHELLESNPEYFI